MQEKYLEALKKFRLIDDAFFSACFDDNAKDVEYILRIILEKDDLQVLKVQTQKSVENMYGRSVRFAFLQLTQKASFIILKYNAQTLAQFLPALVTIPLCLIITN